MFDYFSGSESTSFFDTLWAVTVITKKLSRKKVYVCVYVILRFYMVLKKGGLRDVFLRPYIIPITEISFEYKKRCT